MFDPLPIVNKAYSMIQRVERQRKVTSYIDSTREISANVHRGGNNNFGDSESGSTAFIVSWLGTVSGVRETFKKKNLRSLGFMTIDT